MPDREEQPSVSSEAATGSIRSPLHFRAETGCGFLVLLVGYVSDNSRSQWSTRHTAIVGSAAPLAVAVGTIFWLARHALNRTGYGQIQTGLRLGQAAADVDV